MTSDTSSCSGSVPIVREIWSLEWQNHGESAIINHSALVDDPSVLSLREWEVAARHFVIMKAREGHRLVGIGHSIGSCMLLRSTMSLPRGFHMPYVAMAFIADSLCTRQAWASPTNRFRHNLDLAGKASGRRPGTWADRGQAYQYFSSDKLFKFWDRRILELYLTHALRETLPSEPNHPGITLACTRVWERDWYCGAEYELLLGASDHLRTLDPAFPIHCIYGTREDFIPQSCHDSILADRSMASVHHIENAGHAVVQENPDGVALCLRRILEDISASQVQAQKPKL
ncbi:hypothetical protein CERSUDRAFT_145393 [Gelatoporia subvermispora B]|uniref:AB hydrolase-1 domain-containing protein n=1 Tax=Ceriporiopsis subvermispora (strain B) TaxID=914234 RepID=M2QXF5_CERS8|nr:hypothetical protein CERSUDRAFT_145393 [Gelatoporia subvermispora B]